MDKDMFYVLLSILVVVVVLVGYLIQRGKQELMDEPAVIYSNELSAQALLGAESPCVLEIYRQSGSLYHAPTEYAHSREALKAVQTTLKRAHINAIRIVQNSDTVLEARRAVKSSCGKKSQKVGGFKIYVHSLTQ